MDRGYLSALHPACGSRNLGRKSTRENEIPMTASPFAGNADLFPKITDAGLEALRRRIGVEIVDSLEPWCHEATRDNIRHYADRKSVV